MHESCLDPLETKRAATEPSREDMNVVKTRCTMFLPDFLNYRCPLPPICSRDDGISMLANAFLLVDLHQGAQNKDFLVDVYMQLATSQFAEV